MWVNFPIIQWVVFNSLLQQLKFTEKSYQLAAYSYLPVNSGHLAAVALSNRTKDQKTFQLRTSWIYAQKLYFNHLTHSKNTCF